MDLIIYVLVLSFQLSGSILLLTSCLGKTSVMVLNDCINGNQSLFGKNGIINLGEDAVKESLKKIYMNRISFLMISIGYILSIFNAYTVENEWKMLLILFVVVLLICVLSNWVCTKIAKKNAHKYTEVVVEKLPVGITYYEDYGETK